MTATRLRELSTDQILILGRLLYSRSGCNAALFIASSTKTGGMGLDALETDLLRVFFTIPNFEVTTSDFIFGATLNGLEEVIDWLGINGKGSGGQVYVNQVSSDGDTRKVPCENEDLLLLLRVVLTVANGQIRGMENTERNRAVKLLDRLQTFLNQQQAKAAERKRSLQSFT